MLAASGRAVNQCANSFMKTRQEPQATKQGGHMAMPRQRQPLTHNGTQRTRSNATTGHLDEPLPGAPRSESGHNTSSGSSSGYTSHITSSKQQHRQNGFKQHQLAPYQTDSMQPESHGRQQLMINGDDSEHEVSSGRMMADRTSLRQVPTNQRPNQQQHHQNHHHRTQNYSQLQIQRQLQQRREESRFQADLMAPSMVPMMIDDEDDELDVDGADHLIDDDIELESNGSIPAERLSVRADNNNNNNESANTLNTFDPHYLYGVALNRGARRRPLVDCADSSLSSAPARLPGSIDELQPHRRYLQMVRLARQQYGYSNNNAPAPAQAGQAHHHVMANTSHLDSSNLSTQAIDAQTRLVYNPTSNYEFEALCAKQPSSLLVYEPQFQQQQQQYHSFSYHQPAQQLQLASSNQNQIHLQHPNHYQHLNQWPRSGAAPRSERSASEDQSSGGGGGNSSAADSSPSNRKLVAKGGNSKRANETKKMQQGSRQHLGSPADQHQHHSRHSRNKSGTTSRKKSPPSHSRARSSDRLSKAKDQGSALGCCGKIAKFLLFITNILFWSAGVALVAWGIYSLVDDHKYNLSQLLIFEPSNKMSLFQLLSWSFITLGCAAILVGFCGCSAILKNNRWILGLYIFLILAIFALDLATGLLAIIFQEKLVANVRLRLINKLRSEYGVQASFTAAIDYIQTKFECCGLEGHFDYDQSLWRLQRLGGFDTTVSRTCCHLRNSFDDQAHINPRPVNESMCQSTDVRFHQSYRFRKGCLDDLERMVRQKIWTFTIGCGAVGGVILLSLLFATCFCRSIPSNHNSRKGSASNQQEPSASNHYHHDKTNSKQTGGLTLAQQMDAQQQRHYR